MLGVARKRARKRNFGSAALLLLSPRGFFDRKFGGGIIIKFWQKYLRRDYYQRSGGVRLRPGVLMRLWLVINERLNAWWVSGPFVSAASACVFFENFDAARLGGVHKHRGRSAASWIRLKLILKIRRKFSEFWQFWQIWVFYEFWEISSKFLGRGFFVENLAENFPALLLIKIGRKISRRCY